MLWLIACSDPQLWRADPLVHGALTVDGPIWTAAIATSPGHPAAEDVLARLNGGPPEGTLAENGALGKLRYLLCHDPEARRAFVEPYQDQATSWRFHRVTQCDRPDYCAWMHEVLDAHPAGPWWFGLNGCHELRTRERMLAEAPDAALIEYWWIDARPSGPRIVQFADRAVRDGPVGSMGRKALEILADTPGTEAEMVLLALWDAAASEWKDEVALSLWGRSTERSQALFAEVCARHGDDAPTCRRTRSSRVDPVQWMSLGIDPERLVERFPDERDELIAALGDCAWSAADNERRACARALAKVAPEWIPESADADLALARSPQRISEPLVALGIPLIGAPTGTVLDRLDRAGLTVRLDGPTFDETALLYEIAAQVGLGRPGLEGDDPITFAWLPAPEAPEEGDGRERVQTFFAWIDGTRYRAAMVPDLPRAAAVAAFANGLLEARGLSIRAAVDVDKRRIVLAAPTSLHTLADASLVRFVAAPEWITGPTDAP